jgi:hypothetical protein
MTGDCDARLGHDIVISVCEKVIPYVDTVADFDSAYSVPLELELRAIPACHNGPL